MNHYRVIYSWDALRIDDVAPWLQIMTQTATRCIESALVANIFLMIVAYKSRNPHYDSPCHCGGLY